MANTNVEGPANVLLKDSQKHVCEFCNGSLFQLANDEADENTDLPADTKAWKWENSTPTAPYGNMQTLKLLCTCGRLSGKLIWCLDLCTARGAGSITGTHIACTAAGIPPAGGGGANNLAGLHVTVLGGTDKGVSFPILSNTEADPTVMTITGTPNIDAIGEIIMLSSWKVF